MSFSGFTKSDFDVFAIKGLENRMEALISNVRPKLDALGQHFAPMLSVHTGNEMFPHVAKHARRTVNPPNDTWVAFSSSSRGYKMLPHFQIGLWETHLFVWIAMIYEAPHKAQFGYRLEQKLDEIYETIPQDFVWSGDHMKPEATVLRDMQKSDLLTLFQRLQKIKKAEILCGIHIPRAEAVVLDGQALLTRIEETFKTVMPLYKLASSAD